MLFGVASSKAQQESQRRRVAMLETPKQTTNREDDRRTCCCDSPQWGTNRDIIAVNNEMLHMDGWMDGQTNFITFSIPTYRWYVCYCGCWCFSWASSWLHLIYWCDNVICCTCCCRCCLMLHIACIIKQQHGKVEGAATIKLIQKTNRNKNQPNHLEDVKREQILSRSKKITFHI